MIRYLTLVLFLCVLGCGVAPSKFDKTYPKFVEIKNSRSTINHINDTTLLLSGISNDAQYGYTKGNPIMLGMSDINEGANNRTKYLNALAGPHGEPIIYRRLKPCCPFATPNYQVYAANSKFGLLERYEVSYQGIKEPIILYINLYDEGSLYSPKGFLIKEGD